MIMAKAPHAWLIALLSLAFRGPAAAAVKITSVQGTTTPNLALDQQRTDMLQPLPRGYDTVVAQDGSIYVRTADNAARIKKVSADGTISEEVVCSEPAGYPTGNMHFDNGMLVVDRDGNMYTSVSSHVNSYAFVQKYSPAGTLLKEIGGNNGRTATTVTAFDENSDSTNGLFFNIVCRAFLSGDFLLVGDKSGRLQKFDLDLNYVGKAYVTPGQRTQVTGIAVDSQGLIYASPLSGDVMVFNNEFQLQYTWSAGCQSIRDLDFDGEDNIYVACWRGGSGVKVFQPTGGVQKYPGTLLTELLTGPHPGGLGIGKGMLIVSDWQTYTNLVYSGVPTQAPTPTPTAPPTPLPAVTAKGDPHLQNIHGERFDVNQPGVHVLVQIPRAANRSGTFLRVQARADLVGSSCADMYFRAVNITGAWAGVPGYGGLLFDASRGVQEQAPWMEFGIVKVKVVHARTHAGVPYLNIMFKNFGAVPFPIGGLLGEDDHTQVAERPPGCSKLVNLAGSASGKNLMKLYS